MHKAKLTSSLLIALLVISLGYSQSKTRTKTEVFTVNKDVTLDINTSHADVEFDTWNKDKVEVTATIEIEDATEEEVNEYFENWNFEALGNSEKVTITSKGGHSLFGSDGQFVLAEPIIMEHEFPIIVETPEIAVMPEIAQFVEIPELPMVMMESMEDLHFDYEAFEKDGEAYMKKWKEQWKSGFDEEKFKKEMQEWKKKFESQQKEREKVLKEFYENQSENQKKQFAKIKARTLKAAQKNKEKALRAQELALRKLERAKALQLRKNSKLKLGSDDIFILNNGGKHLKVKKKIKIKMPKKAKLKLNVRHGEVTIAAVGENMDAKLSHAALYANVIEGADTTIETSYAPIHVTKWNEGALKVNFVENVDLQSVNNINLMSNSSRVSVGTLGEKGIISGTFGNLLIHNIGENFQTLDIILENTDARIQLPGAAFKLYYIGSKSNISYPETVVGSENKTQFNTIIRGYQKNSNSGSEININAKFSDVTLQKKS